MLVHVNYYFKTVLQKVVSLTNIKKNAFNHLFPFLYLFYEFKSVISNERGHIMKSEWHIRAERNGTK